MKIRTLRSQSQKKTPTLSRSTELSSGASKYFTLSYLTCISTETTKHMSQTVQLLLLFVFFFVLQVLLFQLDQVTMGKSWICWLLLVRAFVGFLQRVLPKKPGGFLRVSPGYKKQTCIEALKET